jgi:hypothetical protein
MPPLVESLPYVLWILLATLAFGAFAFVVVTRQLTDATRGYLGFTAFCAGLLGSLAFLAGWGLGAGPTDLIVRSPGFDLGVSQQMASGAFGVIGLTYPFVTRSGRAALLLGLAGLVAAMGTLGAAAFGWAPTAVDAVPLLVHLVVLSLATGGALAAIILGHWYLVTPKISEKPLVLQARLLLGVIGLQVLLFVVWTTLGGGPGQDAFDAFSGGNLLLVVLRVLVTLMFPLVLCWMAWRTALTRSMESATGLLYINLAAVMAGTIGAAALYVSTGLLL